MSSLPGEPSAAAAEEDDPAELVPVRLDGKAVRGAQDAAGNQRHLLAALAGRTAQSSVVAAHAEAGVKTNEVPMATAVPGQIDLHGTLVTADAPHKVKATAEFIHQGGGEFVPRTVALTFWQRCALVGERFFGCIAQNSGQLARVGRWPWPLGEGVRLGAVGECVSRYSLAGGR